jgi:hypothetical protein
MEWGSFVWARPSSGFGATGASVRLVAWPGMVIFLSGGGPLPLASVQDVKNKRLNIELGVSVKVKFSSGLSYAI